MLPLQIRELRIEELERVYEIDRSESVQRMYRQSDGALEAYDDSLTLSSEPGFWASHIGQWRDVMERAAISFGAFDGDRLAGFTLFRRELAPKVDQIVALYVSAEYRLSGVAKTLFVEAQQAAKKAGAKQLYVATPPTGSAVGFYLSQGFEALTSPHPAAEHPHPDDIPMVKNLT